LTEDVFTVIIGGKAGQGIKKTGSVIARLFSDMGRYAFEMEDYQSLIRGGHNFTSVSTAMHNISSHYMKADLLILFDQNSYELHVNDIATDGILVYNEDAIEDAKGIGIPMTTKAKKFPNPDLRMGIGAVALTAALAGLKLDALFSLINASYSRDNENNRAFAKVIYEQFLSSLDKKITLKRGEQQNTILYGNQAIALGAAAAGLNIYYAYPMTPSSSILHYFAAHTEELGVVAIHPENEIGVINMAIGSTFTGAKTMVGTSGGGFALMEEGFSLAGMVESPLLCVLASRPGPSTGVPTYTEQADLRFALGQGHGDFPRIIASPGSIPEAFYLTGEMLKLVWKFQTPGILLTEKHLGESGMSVAIDPKEISLAKPDTHQNGQFKRYKDTEDGISPLLFPPSTELIRWDSYEHDEMGITTEKPEEITKMHDKRLRKEKSLIEYLKKLKTVNTFGDSGPLIITYGSTTMSVLESLRAGSIDATVVQPIYLSPFPNWELEKLNNESAIIVEQSSSGQFANLIKEKSGIRCRKLINKYDGRPFEPLKLAKKIKEVISNG
jgi:2-oxoglutarate ferredoxin oxidoreductase subunit alpha